MPGWTVDQALALAPDAASATAGRGLATSGKWESAGASEAAAWGEAKGSGAKPYQVAVDLGDGASKCSCPSRKFPCKHALGLLIRVAKGEVAGSEPPGWATEWLEKRGQKAAVPKAAPKAADPKTAERRWETVLRGLDECEAFLTDVVEGGLLAMGTARSWDEMAARMVDAQAPGAARRFRRIGEATDVRTQAAEIGSLGLLVQAARNIDALGELAHDVRTALGLPARAEATVVDVWDVLGEVVETEERLWTARTWLRGRVTRRWAMRLAFAPIQGPYPGRVLPLTALAAEAKFFPSVWPLRAEFDEAPREAFLPASGGTWGAALEAQADALASNPWLERFPVMLGGATLGDGFVVDSEGVGLPLRDPSEARWRWLARSGNAPSEVFGEFDGEAFTLLSAWGEWGGFAR